MLQAITVDNYQSLHHVELDLAPFTVIVGPSSSGKSALTRALRALTSNQRGTSFISHGERQATIKATTERGTIIFKRGAENSYTIIPTEGEQQSFTKLAQNVPDEVTAFLGIPAKDPLNYASQFDKPYLLSDQSGGEVARILGALTNVNVIFEGAREANRRRQQHSATLRTRTEDIARIKATLTSYQGLSNQRDALSQAEEQLRIAAALQQQLNRLDATVSQLTQAAATLRAAAQQLTIEIPALDLAPIHQVITKKNSLDGLIEQLTQAAALRQGAIASAAEIESSINQLRTEHQQLLASLGTAIHKRYSAEGLIHKDDSIDSHNAANSAASYIAEILA